MRVVGSNLATANLQSSSIYSNKSLRGIKAEEKRKKSLNIVKVRAVVKEKPLILHRASREIGIGVRREEKKEESGGGII